MSTPDTDNPALLVSPHRQKIVQSEIAIADSGKSAMVQVGGWCLYERERLSDQGQGWRWRKVAAA